MKLTRNETSVLAAAGALGLGLMVAAVADSWRWSLLFVDGLLLLLVALVVLALRRHGAARTVTREQIARIERIELKIDNLALRVVTESQATHRELGGLIEELGSTLRDPGREDTT